MQITDPHAKKFTASCSETTITARLSRDRYHFLFRVVFPGERNLKQPLITTLIEALCVELERQGITSYDESNLDRLREILSRVNFRPVQPERPARTGRPHSPAPKRNA